MAQPTFFKQSSPVTLADLAALTGAELADSACAGRTIAGTAALDRAGPMHLTFCENRKYAAQLAQTHAGACFVNDRLAPDVPAHVAALRVAEPYRAFVTAMREHQKVLPTRDVAGALAPHFLAVADHVGDPMGHIVRGNEWVLNARFADARFFWDEDGRVRLEDRVPRLARLSFQEKLGDTLRKAERVEALASRLAADLGLEGSADEAARAARLARADLVTDMVREFPDLQGVVGGLYARRDGESETVCRAIYDHYRPAGVDDALPAEPVGLVVALADRLDTLAGFFALGLVPTGSRDPYALRRAALAVVRILLEGGHRLELPVAIAAARRLHEVPGASEEEVVSTLHPFLLERLRFLLERRGHRHDEIEAVLTTPCPDVTDAAERVAAVSRVRRQPDFGALAASFKRVQNILVQAGVTSGGEIDPALMSDDAERQLAGDFFQARGILDELIGGGRALGGPRPGVLAARPGGGAEPPPTPARGGRPLRPPDQQHRQCQQDDQSNHAGNYFSGGNHTVSHALSLPGSPRSGYRDRTDFCSVCLTAQGCHPLGRRVCQTAGRRIDLARTACENTAGALPLNVNHSGGCKGGQPVRSCEDFLPSVARSSSLGKSAAACHQPGDLSGGHTGCCQSWNGCGNRLDLTGRCPGRHPIDPFAGFPALRQCAVGRIPGENGVARARASLLVWCF